MPHIGVLIVPPIQLLDISPIDLFAMLSQDYFRACNLPQPVIDLAIPTKDLKISYISQSGAGTTVPTTADLNLSITAGLDDEHVAPGKLDILMIPGPPPGQKTDDKVCEFIRRHVKQGVDLLTICSGVQVAAAAGVLDGKRATGTRGVQEMLAKEFPKVKWEDRRYVNDGRLWCSGGITNGMDMVGWYMRKRWPGLADTVLHMADVEPRGQDYETGQVRWKLGAAIKVFRAWVYSFVKGKKE